MTRLERWLLPEGIEELLPPEAWRLHRLSGELVDLYRSWGYDLVVPPFIEYLESLTIGAGHDLEHRTFKLTDQLSGRLLGIRADMTPQVARIDARHLDREAPVRLCYLGEVLHTHPEGLGESRSPFQVGAEVYGHSGFESDVEVLTLLLETLRTAGVENIHLDLGHVGIYRALARQGGLDPDQEQALFDALQRKDRTGVDDLLADFAPGPEVVAMVRGLADLNGGVEVLAAAAELLAGADPAVAAALEDLARVQRAVQARVPDIPLYFDLAELRGYRYQTGVVFAAFVPGHGQEVARGGRYDALGAVFGRARPATGFSADLKTLVKLSTAATDAAPAPGVLAPWGDDPVLLREVAALRAAGERVIQALPGQAGGGAELGCDRELARREGRWTVVPLGA